MKNLECLRHPWLTIRCQIALGAFFGAAALPKLLDPPGFAKSLWAYQLFPVWSLHPIALALPWLELFLGLALCLGLWIRAAAGWVSVLLLGFILALSVNLWRHHAVDCGCFGNPAAPRSEAERLDDMRWAILRDLGLLLLAAQVLASQPRPGGEARPAQP